MSSQNFLNESDTEKLIDLLLLSQQSRTREALCFSIGIDPKRLPFLRDSSDADFFLFLINYLKDIDNKEALCKLCCKELGPVFHKGKYGLFLNSLAGKLNCNQEFRHNSPNNKQQTVQLSSSAPSVSVNPFNQLVKNKLITGSTILIIGLAGVNLFNQNKNSDPPSTRKYILKANNPEGIDILGKQGQTVIIEASGIVNTRPGGEVSDCDKPTGPNGIPDCHYVRENTVPYNEPFMALIGQFGNEPPFAVGNEYTYKFKKEGKLQLRINDFGSRDNQGFFTIETTITN